MIFGFIRSRVSGVLIITEVPSARRQILGRGACVRNIREGGWVSAGFSGEALIVLAETFHVCLFFTIHVNSSMYSVDLVTTPLDLA